MTYSTSNTYQMKREILNFSHKISHDLSKPDRKFSADITYGMLAAQSCLLTDVADQLHEDPRKVNTVDRLARHLAHGTPAPALRSYFSLVRKWASEEAVIHIDDSDIVKPDVFKFEALGIVRDGSSSLRSIPQKKRTSHPSIPSLPLPWNGRPPCLAKPLSSWTKDMTITRCSLSLTVWGRTII